MGTTFLLLAALQIPQSTPLLHSTPRSETQPAPRFSVGAHFSGLAVNLSEGRHTGMGAGVSSVIPVGPRTGIGLRATGLFPSDGFGVYEIRWHRMLKAPRNGKPDYLAAGIAGILYSEIRYRNDVRRVERTVTYPQMLSLATGWSPAVGSRLSLPVEFGVFAHPFGLLVAHASLGVSWEPTRRSR